MKTLLQPQGVLNRIGKAESMQDNQGQQKPQSFERFEDAMKVILAVPKEDVVKQEKADFIQRQKAKKAKGISDAK